MANFKNNKSFSKEILYNSNNVREDFNDLFPVEHQPNILTRQKLRKRTNKMLDYARSKLITRSTDSELFTDDPEVIGYSYGRVTRDGSYRFNIQGCLQQIYNQIKDRDLSEIWTYDTNTALKLKEIFFNKFAEHFPTSLTLTEVLNKIIEHGKFQMGFLTVKNEISLLCPFVKFGFPEDDSSSDAYPNFGNDTQKKFFAITKLYNFYLRYYLSENTFQDIHNISPSDNIRVTIDVPTTEISDENIARWWTMREDPIWSIRVITTWISDNDEITRSIIKTTDFKITERLAFTVGFLSNYKDPQAAPVNAWLAMLPQDLECQLHLNTTAGTQLTIKLIDIKYGNVDLLKMWDTSGTKFDPFTSLISNSANSSQKHSVNISPIIFFTSGPNNHQTTKFIFNGNATTGNRRYFYPDSNTPFKGTLLNTHPYIYVTNNSDLIEVDQFKPASAAFNSVSVITSDGQQITTIPFQYSNFDQGKYTFTAITDNIKYIDAVYVLGNKI